MNIEQMFQNPITREINGVIKAGARDSDTVLEEIKEYVVTTEIRKNMREFFSAYASSFANKKNLATSSGSMSLALAPRGFRVKN